jgi:integrase
VEKTRPTRKALNESDLLYDHEVDALLDAANFDVDQFRRWGIEKHIEKHGRTGMRPCKDSFGDMLQIYHATGARTSELAVAKVGDFSPRSHQIVLGKHKTSETQTTPTVRAITLGDEALEIVKRRCHGRGPDEFIFLTAWGKPFTKKTLNTRLHSVRRIAVALGAKIRKDVTIYDFRHLWISDQMVADTPLLTVAKMAGTSVAMIERVYGHFRKDHLVNAQRRLEEARRSRREKAANQDPSAST